MVEWTIWGVLLILQNASHTATSRARNTKGVRGLWYNGIASIFSNGIWIVSQAFIVNMLLGATSAWQQRGEWGQFVLTVLFYIALTMFGSVAAQWYLMREEAKRGLEHG